MAVRLDERRDDVRLEEDAGGGAGAARAARLDDFERDLKGVDPMASRVRGNERVSVPAEKTRLRDVDDLQVPLLSHRRRQGYLVNLWHGQHVGEGAQEEPTRRANCDKRKMMSDGALCQKRKMYALPAISVSASGLPMTVTERSSTAVEETIALAGSRTGGRRRRGSARQC